MPTFFKRHRVMIIVPTVLAAEFYVWWRIQSMDCFVPAHERKDIFVRPLEYAKKLYESSYSSSSSNDKDKHEEKKTVV